MLRLTTSATSRPIRDQLRRWAAATRPDDPNADTVLAERWAELPERVRTPAQLLGRKFTGCEGTHGVFPACDFGCQPCYHSASANRVPIDGAHTLAEVDAQMSWLERNRGRGQYAQLIGGEVSLLPPDVHAEALATMRRHGRIPMSFTHGDFDDDYLEAVVLGPDGAPRFADVAFAVHVDSTMRGRRAVKSPDSEAELHDERARIAAMFDRLRKRHGVRSYLAHNMTVTPDNLDEVPEVVRVCRRLGYRMCSFQPAAAVGDQRRWGDGYRDLTADAVWAEVERGAGRPLPHTMLQVGDPRCTRSTWGVWAGERYLPVFEDDDPRDLAARDAWLTGLPANLRLDPWSIKLARACRSLARHSGATTTLLRWAGRFAPRLARSLAGTVAGRDSPGRLPGPPVLATTYVMHRFMDAADVQRAWTMMEAGIEADDPATRETQERLQACAYSMAHPEQDRAVPACVQHSILDDAENEQLIQLLPGPPGEPGVVPVASAPESAQPT